MDILEDCLVVIHFGFCPWQFFFVVDVPFAGTDFAEFEFGEVGVFGEVGEEDVVVCHMCKRIVIKTICQPFIGLFFVEQMV